MRLDTKALREAQQLFIELLRSEAEQQHAHVSVQRDGCVSLELEGVDFDAMIRAVVTTYLDEAASSSAVARTKLSIV